MKISLIPITLLLLLLVGCTGGIQMEKNSDIKISAAEAKGIIDEKEDVTILDVRMPEEFADGHLENALLIPDYELDTRAEAELADKDALILVYCRSGRRSEAAARKLTAMGYTNIHDMGGILDWPYETVR